MTLSRALAFSFSLTLSLTYTHTPTPTTILLSFFLSFLFYACDARLRNQSFLHVCDTKSGVEWCGSIHLPTNTSQSTAISGV